MGKIVVRVDDRLIHGQTIVAWCPTLAIQEIIAIDDESAKNPMLKSIMTMSVPPLYKTHIVTTEEARSLLSQDNGNNRLVIVRFPKQLEDLEDTVLKADFVMLGNIAKRPDSVHGFRRNRHLLSQPAGRGSHRRLERQRCGRLLPPAAEHHPDKLGCFPQND